MADNNKESHSLTDAVPTNDTSASEASDAIIPTSVEVASAHHAEDDDAFLAQKYRAIEQLYNIFGFSYDVAQQAVDYITETTISARSTDDPSTISGATIDLAACYNYILDSGLGQDRGGPVTPIDACPHVTNHYKISIGQIPIQPSHAQCSYVSTNETGTTKPKGNLKSDVMYEHDNNEDVDAGHDMSTGNKLPIACNAKENWLCLECGVVRCSRYCMGHALQHWEDTRPEPEADGHCVAVSLSDLSIWCHLCQSYLSTTEGSTGHVIQPLVSRLEYNKFHLEGDTTIILDNSHEQPPNTKRLKHNNDIDDEDDELEVPDGDGQTTTDQADDDGAPQANEDNEADDDDKDDEADDDDDEDDDHDEDDHDDNDDRQALLQKLMVIAEERGIPLEWLILQANQLAGEDSEDDEDDTPVVYPFDKFPTSIDDVAKFIMSDQCRKILVLAGAGMSVASGIPDFRSADGLYATLNPNLLSANDEEKEAIRLDPTVSLDQHMFLQNPLPCLELQREFILGTREQRWKATLAHRFIELLHTKTNKLARHYTQNIDGLEDQCTQIPSDKVIAVHGSMDRAECARCHTESDFNDFCDSVRTQIKDLSGKDSMAPSVSTPIECSTCGFTSMKPAIVLFRSSLPKEFAQNVPNDVQDVDLLIVIGTSLRVAPANSLVRQVPKSAMRLLVNREEAGGHLGMKFDEPDPTRDYFAQGECDAVFLELMDSLGWIDELEYLLPNKLLPDSSDALLREYLEQRRVRKDNTSS